MQGGGVGLSTPFLSLAWFRRWLKPDAAGVTLPPLGAARFREPQGLNRRAGCPYFRDFRRMPCRPVPDIRSLSVVEVARWL